MAIPLEQLELLFAATISSDEASIRSATASLESAEATPGFPFSLLTLASGPIEEGRRLAAATYLKNLLKAQWHKSDFMQANERPVFRNQLVDALLQVDSAVLKTFAEAFSVILAEDFVRNKAWPELIPAMKTAFQMSNLLNRTVNMEVRTYNLLVTLQAMIKPFRYFTNPKLAKEPVPDQLEMISENLLVPLYQYFHSLIEEAKLAKGCASSSDNDLLILCKCFHLAVRSHMPSSLLPRLESWCEEFSTLLGCIEVHHRLEGDGELPRLKCWKRVLKIFCTLVNRHRKHVDKFLPKLSTMLLDIAAKAAYVMDLHPLQERVISSAFDTISNILETGPGWRLIATHFSSLLEKAIFPALKLKEKDIVDWNEDPEEYLRKNLPSDDDTSGWRDDLYTPRKSALNLLGLISTSKGPPSPVLSNGVSSAKRKKAGKNSRRKDAQGTAGELLIVPFLSRFSVPPDNCPLTSESVINYYGALLAYGGLQQFFKAQRPEHLQMLLLNRVLCLYRMTFPSPFLLANANWVIGQFASCVPEELNKEIYDALLKAFQAPDVADLTWRPVRTSAAAALTALLEEEYKPVEWLPLLQAAVNGGKSHDNDEASLAFRVLGTAADVGEEDILPHLPAIISAVKAELYNHIPSIPEPWPQVVESGFSALAAMTHTWDASGMEEDGKITSETDWEKGCFAIGSTISELLQQAWLLRPEESANQDLSPPPSCLNDASALVAVMCKYVNESDLILKWKIEEILQAWSDLIAEWSAWDEEEDLAVFDAMKEIILLQGKHPLPHFAVAPIPPPPAAPVQPRSILEGMTTFISCAIETAYAAATWRACRLGHSLLHVSLVSFESEEITPVLSVRFTQAAIHRFMNLNDCRAPLSKPLVLLIAAFYFCSSSAVAQVLSETDVSGSRLLVWSEALTDLILSEEGPGVALESELKICVAVTLRMLEDLCSQNLLQDSKMVGLRNKLASSLLKLSVLLKELQDAEDESKDGDMDSEEGDTETEEDDDDDDDEDSEDDDKLEETEDQFLERYARRAQELEEEALDEAEGGDEEDGCELEIGVLSLTDQMPSVYSFLQKYGKQWMNESALSHELVREFMDNFSDSARFFH
ncbi:hypothetical protein KP509_29G060400 [Ceratopteris richardii]|uniref:Importin N-terminal domain-containing protein n=1 Tax=Ceratopteris richardii TaxID=49495 RepID=A0A8T2R7A9_CERRI|nr:hypothetical protein KP509_29G060400 [Ceratopteris richardii]